ncbi:zinc transporter ZntB [Thalassotalea maritima]|uniref:zinc transporter ZntB n=1 Tax=Thalassotalea maritima TaxID=3242416 RepID=UPI0035284F39
MNNQALQEYDFNLQQQAKYTQDCQEKNICRWLHLNYTDVDTKQQLEKLALNSMVVDALLSEETRPRANLIDEGLIVSLRGINLAKNSDPEDMVSIRIFMTADDIVSTGRRRLVSLESIADDIHHQRGPRSPSHWLVELIYNLNDNMAGTVHFIEETLSTFEDGVIDNRQTISQSDLANLRRQIISIRRYLGPQRDALLVLISDKNKLIEQEQKAEIREALNHLQLYIEELDLCKERANVLQEEINVQLGQTMNNRMYVLSIVAGIFLPLGFLTGLLGINVGGIPGMDDPNAFYIVTLILLVITGLLMLLLKKNKWL